MEIILPTSISSRKRESPLSVGGASLVAYWPFDDGSGLVLHDASGNGHDGIIDNATWSFDGIVQGKRCLTFDGGISKVTIAGGAWLPVPPVTINAWSYAIPSDRAFETYRIIGRAFNQASPGSFAFDAEPGVFFYSPELVINQNRTFDVNNRWVMATLVIDVTSISVFCNAEIVETVDAITDFPLSMHDVVIGLGDTQNLGMIGKLSEISIYNRVLGIDELRLLMNSFAQTDGLVAELAV